MPNGPQKSPESTKNLIEMVEKRHKNLKFRECPFTTHITMEALLAPSDTNCVRSLLLYTNKNILFGT